MSGSSYENPLTLDKAIEHAEDVAEACATSCQREHKQLASWLRELKERRKYGNVAAMRKALEIAKKAICNHARANHTCISLAWESDTANANCGYILCGHRDLCEAKTAIQKALSAPPRNCDVGTAEEQAERFEEFCDQHRCPGGWNNTSPDCPIKSRPCEFVWAQMPYEDDANDYQREG